MVWKKRISRILLLKKNSVFLSFQSFRHQLLSHHPALLILPPRFTLDFISLLNKEYWGTSLAVHWLRLFTAGGPGMMPGHLENPMDRGDWWAAVHGVAKSRTWLSDFTFTFHFHALEKDMATHSSVLAWRIPGTREPGGLPSMGSHRGRTRLKRLSRGP